MSPRKKGKPAPGPSLPPGPGPRLVIGIGASAGGIEPLCEILKNLPADTGMAVVVVLHLDPGRESMLDQVLGRSSRMPVVAVEEGAALLPNHVYVIPPNQLIRVAQGHLHLEPLRTRVSEAIDVFFRSLAEAFGDRAVGVVLSGHASDGTAGLEAIKCQGGITIVQDEHSARFASMPTSAIATGLIDFVLPPEQIAQQLCQLATHPLAEEIPAHKNDQTLARVLALVTRQFGVDFTKYKPTTINRRLLRRMMLHRVDTLEGYHNLLRSAPKEVEALYHDLLISVTGLFRDPEVYDYLKSDVLPALLDAREVDQTLRVWVPGCSRGDEVYSLCICILDLLRERSQSLPIQVFATDVNERAIDEARQGFYPDNLPEQIAREHLRRYFVRSGGGYQIAKHIRDLCVFARHDLTRDPPFSRLDLISCRNVLIYLRPELQQRILRTFHYGLKNNGVLLLGGSESLGRAADLYVELDKQHRVFSKRPVHTPIEPDMTSGQPGFYRPADPPEPPFPTPSPSLAEVQREADRLVLARFAPSGVIVNAQLDVLHYRGRIGPYLEPPPGGVTHNVLSLAREGMLSDLRASVQEAQATGITARRQGVRVRTDDGYVAIDLEVIPLRGPSSQGHLLILFEPAGPPAPIRQAEAVVADGEVQRLRDELEATREYLNAINQQQAATNEDLKAAYEEIQSANEELQSTNEELETAKEELQSTNEELTTLNEELYERNLELTRSNNDLNNLLASVSIPVIILGPDLRIRRFTPMAERVLNLIPGDVGRQLGDLRLNLEVPDLQQRILDVLDSLYPQEIELRDREGRWHSVRIRPYRTAENHIDGAVVVFVDVDQLKRSLDQAESLRELAHSLLGERPLPTAVLDQGSVVQVANDLFCKLLGVEPDQVEQHELGSLGDGQLDSASVRKCLAQAARGPRAGTAALKLGERKFRMVARRLSAEGADLLVLVSLEDGGKP